MSPRLPRVTAGQVIRALEVAGFRVSRQSGSHRIYVNDLGRRVTVPYHSGKILHPKVLTFILKDAAMDSDQFLKFLKGK